ncbi:MAG: D,D-heptose 1,7-bisphosphate phosphatase [Firmicutes bacterium]|nr:D,D-heptose 1,7-bisphosphate phosphatase [Bacillota bacterium]
MKTSPAETKTTPSATYTKETPIVSLEQYSRPAVFFDRDGVLNVDSGFVYRPEDFRWIDGAIQTIKLFNTANYLVFVITNQSGVARGYYSEFEVQQLHTWMNAQLATQKAHIDAFYYCPHHQEAKHQQYRKACDCRKPMPGLIQQAFAGWSLDKNKSFLVGDKNTDLQAAAAAGIRGYLFNEENLFDFITNLGLIKQY